MKIFWVCHKLENLHMHVNANEWIVSICHCKLKCYKCLIHSKRCVASTCSVPMASLTSVTSTASASSRTPWSTTTTVPKSWGQYIIHTSRNLQDLFSFLIYFNASWLDTQIQTFIFFIVWCKKVFVWSFFDKLLQFYYNQMITLW